MNSVRLRIAFLSLFLAGTAFASGDFDQTGGRPSHQCYVPLAPPSSSPSTTTATSAGSLSSDPCYNAVIGPSRDIWTVAPVGGAPGKLYRYSFSISSMGSGSFTQQWNTALDGGGGGVGGPTVAVDSSGNSYVIAKSFESFNSSGTRRMIGMNPWLQRTEQQFGVALTEYSHGGTNYNAVLWGFQGTIFLRQGWGRAYIWDTSGNQKAAYPPSQAMADPFTYFQASGQPCIGPYWDSGSSSFPGAKAGYFVGHYRLTDAMGNVAVEDWRIIRANLDTGTFDPVTGTSAFYIAPAGTILYSAAAEDVDTNTLGDVYCWAQSNTGAWSLLHLDKTGSLVASTSAAPGNAGFDPPALGGGAYVYARDPNTAGRIRMIQKTSPYTVTDYTTTNFGSVGPITVAADASNEYLIFRGGSTGYVRKVVFPNLNAHFTFTPITGTSAFPVGTANKSGGLTRPVIYHWASTMGGGGALRALFDP